jgi:purine-binding chemotaxis protein CheW
MTHTTNAVANTGEVSEISKKLAGKYLTFRLGNEEYGLQILKVQEIIQMQPITRIPKTPDYILGVINLRGKIIPVLDLRRKFGLEPTQDTDKTCINVVQIVDAKGQNITIGIRIDEVKEVLDIAASNIQETPSFGSAVDTDFILGLGKIGDSVKILLDIDKAISATDTAIIANLAAEKKS